MNRNVQELPNEIAGQFPGLTLSQYRLLCYSAFRGEYPTKNWTREKYEETFHVKNGKTSSDKGALVAAGWIVGDSVVPEYYFEIIISMLRNFPEWEIPFKALGRFRNDKELYLWKVATCLSSGDLEAAKWTPYPKGQGLWRYFARIVLHPEHGKAITFIPEEEQRELLENILESALFSDKLDDTLAWKVKEIAYANLLHPQTVMDTCDAYAYYATGKHLDDLPSSPSVWSLGLEGIRLVYAKDYMEAFQSFTNALQLDKSVPRYSFRDPILTWFYAICLVNCCKRMRSVKAKEALDKLMDDSWVKFESRHVATRILLTFWNTTNPKDLAQVSKEVTAALEDASPLSAHFLLLVSRYFRISEDNDTAQLMIVRHELSALMPLHSAEKAALEATFGGPAALCSIPRKENWEMALSEIVTQVQQEQEEARLERRLIYFFNDKWMTAILEQTRRNEDEAWGNDRLLSRVCLLRNEYSQAMDMVDIKLVKELSFRTTNQNDFDIAIPILAGTGRIFTGQHYSKPYTPLEIETEEPVISFNGKDGAIVVSSNVQRMEDGSAKMTSISQRGKKMVCVKINAVQRDILTNLLNIGQFPANAAPAIRGIIDSLNGIIQVKSNLTGNAIIPTVRGSARIALRISPDKTTDVYAMDIKAAPYEDGYLRVDPGQGNEDVYDDTVDSARFIKRDLQLEYDNYMEFHAFAEEEVDLEFETPTHAFIACSSSLLQVLEWAHDHQDKCFVEWPEGRALRFRGTLTKGDIEVAVSSNIDWFSVEGDAIIDKDRYDLKELLNAMRSADINGFVKLGDRDFIRMEDTLRKHLEALDEMMNGRRGRNRVVPVFRVGQLAKVLGQDGGLGATMDEGFKQLLNRMQTAYESTPELPEDLHVQLRDYQKEGYIWMKRLDAWGAGACLADDMGLGKTVQSLAFILSKSKGGPSLVIAPKSVIPNWDMEISRFAPTLRATVLNNENHREDFIAKAGPRDVILATYGVLGTEAQALASREWNVVCLDEAQQIKNRNTRASAAAMGLQARSRIILTGTPLQNHLGELWNLFQFINPGLLGEWSDFYARYMRCELDDERKTFLRDLIQPFILRRTKEEVLDELPEKMVYEQMVELTPDEMNLYEAMRVYVEDRIKGKGKKKKRTVDDQIQIDFFAELTRLRMAACSMSLVHDDWQKGSSKTEALLGLLDEISCVEDNRVLIFSQFTSYLAQVKAVLDRQGMRYLYMDGQTDLEERQGLVAQFQNGDCPIFIVSLKAGGLGLNLTAANYVILLDPWWNPAIENQAMDRAHRIGQQRNVTVIRLIARHTIEEKILHLHESKQALSDEMLDGTADSYHLTMDDILDMVSPFR